MHELASPDLAEISEASTAFNSPERRCPGGAFDVLCLQETQQKPGPRTTSAHATAHYFPSNTLSRALTTAIDSRMCKDLRRAKLKGAKMSRQNLSNVDFTDADLRNCDLRHCDLSGAKLPSWDSGLLEGVRLSGAKGWIPANKDMRYARLQGADLSGGHDLSYVDLTNADLRDCNLKQANLHRAVLLGAQGGREETIEAASYASRRGLWNDLKVDQPIVFSLTVAAALRVRFVVLANMHGPTRTCDSNDCVRRFEVFTASQEEGPWSSVTALCASKVAPKVRQTFEVADDAALVAGFVKVVVHDTYGGKCCLASLQLVGEAFG